MKSIRLLPIIMVAITALLVLKTTGLVTRGGYVLTGAEFARAQSAAGDQDMSVADVGEDREEAAELSDSAVAAADRAAESLFARDEATPDESIPVMERRDGEKVELEEAGELTEQALLARLTERRMELDARAEQLDMREVLVEAAEKRLNERIAELEELEADVQALVDEKQAMEDEQFAALVSMYENMRPKEAASVFNALEMDVLHRLARHMNARKMSPILAEMSTERARDLTLMLAVDEDMELSDAGSEGDFSDLPQIVGE